MHTQVRILQVLGVWTYAFTHTCSYSYVDNNIYTGVPGGKVNILGGHSIGHSKKKSLYDIWRAILSFPPAVMRHCLKHVNRCEASVGCWLLLIGPVILEDRMTTKLLRISAKWITRTTRGCSFAYKDCSVLAAWRSPSSLYPTYDATSQWHVP
jgi:hypothetical protein